jgi:hypothetical protein
MSSESLEREFPDYAKCGAKGQRFWNAEMQPEQGKGGNDADGQGGPV